MFNKSLKLLFLAAFVLIPSISEAKDIPPGRWWRLPYFYDQLNITGEQKVELDKLYDFSRNRLVELKKQLEEEKRELTTMLEERDLDETFALAQMKKLENTRTVLAATRFSYSLGVRKLLGHDRFQRLKILYRNFHGIP